MRIDVTTPAIGKPCELVLGTVEQVDEIVIDAATVALGSLLCGLLYQDTPPRCRRSHLGFDLWIGIPSSMQKGSWYRPYWHRGDLRCYRCTG